MEGRKWSFEPGFPARLFHRKGPSTRRFFLAAGSFPAIAFPAQANLRQSGHKGRGEF